MKPFFYTISIIISCLFFIVSNGYSVTVMVVTEEFPPFNYTEDGKVIGASTEIVKEVLNRANINYTIRPSPMEKGKKPYTIKSYPWEKAYKIALEQSNVLIYSIVRTPKRENLFKWVDEIAPYNVYLYKMKNRTDIKPISTIYELKAYKIGGVRDTAAIQYLERNGFISGKHLDLVTNKDLLLNYVLQKRVDLFPIDEISAIYTLKKAGLKIANFEIAFPLKDISSGLYMAFSLKTNDDVVEKCRKVLTDMKSDGSYDKIMSPYLNQ